MNEKHPYRPFATSAISWLTVALGLLTIGTFIATSNPQMRYITPMAVSVGSVTMETSGSYGGATPPMPNGAPIPDQVVTNVAVSGAGGGSAAYYPPGYPYPYYNQDVPATDTREFLKVYYNASMRTRDVQGLTHRVETTVRGYDGRIDQESSSPQYGSISFAIPMSSYDAFRNDIEAMVGSRFLTVNISSQNMLPQKLSIEQQQAQADQSLADFTASRQKIVSAHASTVKSLQARIDADAQQVTSLGAQGSTPQIQAQIQAALDDSASLKKQLVNENSSYTAQLSNADANIKYATDMQKAVQTQDQTLLDNVGTVTGTISIQWISLWEMAQLYLPGYWIPGIFALLTILSYINDRRRFLTV